MARYSGYMVSVLPVAVAGLLFVMNPEYMSTLWKDPCGVRMIVASAIGMGLGWVIIRQIVNIKV
jgi:tight adherence protein B